VPFAAQLRLCLGFLDLKFSSSVTAVRFSISFKDNMSDLEKVGSNSKKILDASTGVEQSSFVTVNPATEKSYGEHSLAVCINQCEY
jgi:hypothetical protein